MTWILIGIVAGSIVVSGHDTEEACKGREAMLLKQKIPAKCVEAPGRGSSLIYSGSGSSTTLTVPCCSTSTHTCVPC